MALFVRLRIRHAVAEVFWRAGQLRFLARIFREVHDAETSPQEVQSDIFTVLTVVEANLNASGASASAFEVVLVDRCADDMLHLSNLF